jgi:competence protein ComEA
MTRWLTAASIAFGTAALVIAQGQSQPPAGQPPTQLRTFTPEEIAALSQGLPEGKSRELVVRVCAQCHEPQRAAAVRLTREGWEGEVSKMMGLGAKMTDDEYTQIVDYLAENYKGEAPKPINMNSATSVELESVAGLLRKEAAAWIAYRTRNGPCKSLDDLKKVEGLPFSKIDDRRDRLGCF